MFITIIATRRHHDVGPSNRGIPKKHKTHKATYGNAASSTMLDAESASGRIAPVLSKLARVDADVCAAARPRGGDTGRAAEPATPDGSTTNRHDDETVGGMPDGTTRPR